MSNKTIQIMILNAPPNSGKDVIGQGAAMMLPNAKVVEFKECLYSEAADFAKVNFVELKERCTNRNTKDAYWSEIAQKSNGEVSTPRELLIHVSEKIIKPSKGSGYFGVRAAHSVHYLASQRDFNKFIFTDGGFEDEVIFLIKTLEYHGYKVGVCIVGVQRDGAEWGNDSRRRLEAGSIHCNTLARVKSCTLWNHEGHVGTAISEMAYLTHNSYTTLIHA